MQELQAPDEELTTNEAPYVGQIVPPPTFFNATMREKLDTSYMNPARLDAEEHKRWKSRGM